MTDHVTPDSHPELTEGQRKEVNARVSKWKFLARHPEWPKSSSQRDLESSELANAVECIVAEVTA